MYPVALIGCVSLFLITQYSFMLWHYFQMSHLFAACFAFLLMQYITVVWLCRNYLLIVSLIFNAVQLYGLNNVLAIIASVFRLFC